MELTKVDQRKCVSIAFAIICLAEKENELKWLTENTFILHGLYEKVARKLFDELDGRLIDCIDNIINKSISIEIQ